MPGTVGHGTTSAGNHLVGATKQRLKMGQESVWDSGTRDKLGLTLLAAVEVLGDGIVIFDGCKVVGQNR